MQPHATRPDTPRPDTAAPGSHRPDRRPWCTRHRAHHPVRRRDDGAQALELVMATPIVLMLTLLVLCVGQAGLAAVRSQQLAGLAARLAATQPDDAVTRQLAHHLRDGDEVHLDPPSPARRPGDLVTATVQRRVPVLLLPGTAVPVVATATAMTDQAAP